MLSLSARQLSLIHEVIGTRTTFGIVIRSGVVPCDVAAGVEVAGSSGIPDLFFCGAVPS